MVTVEFQRHPFNMNQKDRIVEFTVVCWEGIPNVMASVMHMIYYYYFFMCHDRSMLPATTAAVAGFCKRKVYFIKQSVGENYPYAVLPFGQSKRNRKVRSEINK